MLRTRRLSQVSLLLLSGCILATTNATASQVVGTAKAPDFAFQTASYGWQHLHDLCSDSAVLLLLNPSEQDLVKVQSCTAELAAAHVTPVAVTNGSDSDNWKTLDRLGLSFALLSDPAGVVVGAFGLRDSGQSESCLWVVIDGHQNIRSVRDDGLSNPDFMTEAMGALATDPRLIGARRAE